MIDSGSPYALYGDKEEFPLSHDMWKRSNGCCAQDILLSQVPVPGRATDGRQSAKTLAERQDRTRERNRKAQRRYREKQKEECDKLEQQIQDLKTRKADAQAVWVELHAHRHALLDRIVSSSNHPSPASSTDPNDSKPAAVPSRAGLTQIQAPAHLLNESAAAAPPKPHSSSLVRPGNTTSNLYARRPVLPPPASSFRDRAAITYEDLLAASGSTSRIIDLSTMSYMDVVQAAQSAAAQRLGCSQADICWYVQSQYEVAPGLPLSYTTCLSTPQCGASLALHSTIAQLEAAVLSATSSATYGLPPGHLATATAPLTESLSSATPAGSAQPAGKRSCRETPRAREASGASVRLYDEDHMHDAHACTPAEDRGTGLATGSVAGVCSVRPVQNEVHAHDGDMWHGGVFAEHGDANAWLKGTCECAAAAEGGASGIPSSGGASATCTHALFGAELGADAPSATAREGPSVSCGVGEVCDGRAAVRAVMQQFVESVAQHSALDRVAVADIIRHCGDATAKIVSLFEPQDIPDPREHATAAELGRCADAGAPPPCPPAAAPLAAGAAGAAARGEGDDAVLSAYHTAVTAMLCAVLRCTSDVCYEVSEGWRAGTVQAGAAVEPLLGDVGERRRHEKLFAALTELCTGHALAMRDSGRVMRSMSLNIMSRFLLHYEFENVHVRLYRDLRLTAEQRERMAAWWHSWLRHKCTLNATTAAAQQTLNSLPDTLPLPNSHLSHICRLAAGTAPPRTCAACAGQGRGSAQGLRQESGVMHGVHACQGSGSECMHAAAGGDAAAGYVGRSICSGCGACTCALMHGVLLGADAGSMCRAAEALRLLGRMHDEDGALSVRAIAMHDQPESLLDTGQVAWLCRKFYDKENKAPDTMALCQLAATQLRRQELRRWPAILGQPLPERM